jgi:hypothetical protein
MPKKPCIECGERPKYGSRQRCSWCWIAREPIELQESWAAYRLSKAPQPHRARVPAAEWPEGKRWCSGCQWMVPLAYVDGSRCRACASRARHRAYVDRTYGQGAGEAYEALMAYQEGRCYICQQMPRSGRLAVDHDHRTGEIRGLLCAGQEQGCNWNFRKALNDPDMARRLLEYAQEPPMKRLRSGQV